MVDFSVSSDKIRGELWFARRGAFFSSRRKEGSKKRSFFCYAVTMFVLRKSKESFRFQPAGIFRFQPAAKEPPQKRRGVPFFTAETLLHKV